MDPLIHTLLQPLALADGEALVAHLVRQRWFRSKTRRLADCRFLDVVSLRQAPPLYLALVHCRYQDEAGAAPAEETYLLPLVITTADGQRREDRLFPLPAAGAGAWLADGGQDAEMARTIADGILAQHTWAATHGRFVCRSIPSVAASYTERPGKAAPLRGEQSNSCFLLGRQLILKLIRKLEAGINPDVEVMETLTRQASFPHVPKLVGHLVYEEPTREAVVGVLQEFVPNEGDGWSWMLASLRDLVGRSSAEHGEPAVSSDPERLEALRRLGQITAELHLALIVEDAPAFRPERITEADLREWRQGILRRIRTNFGLLAQRTDLLPSGQPQALETLQQACERQVGNLSTLVAGGVQKIRLHGDYHLGQVLKVGEPAAFVVLDFEGEPARPIEERRAKGCVLKDLAGMLRSFSYALEVALQEGDRPVAPMERGRLEQWERRAREAFVRSYQERMFARRPELLPPPQWLAGVLGAFELDKAVYELGYELNNRPSWSSIPLRALVRLAGA